MENLQSVFRWTARITGTLMVLFSFIMFLGYAVEGIQKSGTHPPSSFSLVQIGSFIFWFLGLAGMIWAWWKEGTGGLFSLICTIIFLILVKVNAVTNPEGTFTPVLFIFLMPPLFYLISWWMAMKQKKDENE